MLKTTEQVMGAVRQLTTNGGMVSASMVGSLLNVAPHRVRRVIEGIHRDGKLDVHDIGGRTFYTLPKPVNPDRFAILVESEKYGQILAMKGDNSEGEPGIKFCFTTGGTGVNEWHVGVDEDELDEAFSKLTDSTVLDTGEAIVADAIKRFGDFIGGGE